MILYGDSEGIAKRCINVVLRKARNSRVVELDIFKDEVARAVFLKGHKVDKETRLIGRHGCCDVEKEIWFAAGVYSLEIC